MTNVLSPREMEVLREIISGATNVAIARHLFISLATAKAHVSSIFRKLNAVNRVDAAVKGMELLNKMKLK